MSRRLANIAGLGLSRRWRSNQPKDGSDCDERNQAGGDENRLKRIAVGDGPDNERRQDCAESGACARHAADRGDGPRFEQIRRQRQDHC